jgi:hypothetical protein
MWTLCSGVPIFWTPITPRRGGHHGRVAGLRSVLLVLTRVAMFSLEDDAALDGGGLRGLL